LGKSEARWRTFGRWAGSFGPALLFSGAGSIARDSQIQVIEVALRLLPTSDTIIIMDLFEPPKPTTKAANRIVEGMRVSHAKFGIGIVKEKIGRQMFRVTFEDHSTKTIRHDFLSLI
jgi:hypothetical protein